MGLIWNFFFYLTDCIMRKDFFYLAPHATSLRYLLSINSPVTGLRYHGLGLIVTPYVLPIDSVFFCGREESFVYNIYFFFDIVINLRLLKVYDRDVLVLSILS